MKEAEPKAPAPKEPHLTTVTDHQAAFLEWKKLLLPLEDELFSKKRCERFDAVLRRAYDRSDTFEKRKEVLDLGLAAIENNIAKRRRSVSPWLYSDGRSSLHPADAFLKTFVYERLKNWLRCCEHFLRDYALESDYYLKSNGFKDATLSWFFALPEKVLLLEDKKKVVFSLAKHKEFTTTSQFLLYHHNPEVRDVGLRLFELAVTDHFNSLTYGKSRLGGGDALGKHAKTKKLWTILNQLRADPSPDVRERMDALLLLIKERHKEERKDVTDSIHSLFYPLGTPKAGS